MSRNKKTRKGGKRKSPPSSTGKRALFRAFLALVVVIAVAVVVLRFWPGEPPPIPELDLEAMEPQVARKVSEHRGAVEEEPRSHEAWGRLGMVLHAHGHEREAARCYQEALELEPSEFRWHYLLVHALRSFDAEGALEQAARALAVDSSYAPAHLIRGELLEERGETDAALEHYQKALALDPESAAAAFGVGRLRLARGELEASLASLQRAAEIAGGAGPIHATLAQVHRRLGEREKAMEEARLASELASPIPISDPIHFEMRRESVSSIAQLERAREAAEAGDYRRAETIYRELVDLRPDDADMHARLGDVLARQDRRQEAREGYSKALDINPEHAAALYGLGNMLSFEKKFEEAAECYRKSLEIRPEHVPTLLNLGGIQAYQGKLGEAIATLEKVLVLEPGSFEAHERLSEVFLRQRNVDQAIAHLRAALESRPDAGGLHFNLAMALAEKGRRDEAWEHLERAEALGKTVPPRIRRALQPDSRTP